MDRRFWIGAAGMVLVGAGLVGSQFANGQVNAPVGIVTEADNNPFAGLNRILAEDLPALSLTEERARGEREFLRMHPVLDQANVAQSDTANVPYRRCQKDPMVASSAFDEASQEAYAKRMIYSFVQAKRVVDLRDCTCNGKVAPFGEVTKIIAEIEQREGPDWNRGAVGRDHFNRSRPIYHQAEGLCGEF